MTAPTPPEAAGLPARIVLGTRGSRLALAQARWVEEQLRTRVSSLEVVIRIVKTTGDLLPSTPIASGPSVGLFVREIEEELLAGRIDLAVHSLKDLPLEQPEGLRIAAIPVREDPHDVLVTRDGSTLRSLPAGAKVGTGSPRRVGQIRSLRGDLTFEGIRGNVDTRLRKLEEGVVDALVLAAAGLNRMGSASGRFAPIPFAQMLPAPGQGALGVEIRGRDSALGEMLRQALDDVSAACEARAERAFLGALGGGCQMPVGCLGRTRGESLELEGVVVAPDGSRAVRDSRVGSSLHPEELGWDLGRRILAAGAGEILE
jgi:hydroxymethylbilane synthase